jgi:hypothetical protein
MFPKHFLPALAVTWIALNLGLLAVAGVIRLAVWLITGA